MGSYTHISLLGPTYAFWGMYLLGLIYISLIGPLHIWPIHTFTYIRLLQPICGHIYIHTPSPAKQVRFFLVAVHTWRNVVGLWPMFDVLRAYVHTYICIQTHILQYVMCVYISLHAHLHIYVCVCV